MFASWPCPLPGGETAQENARVCASGRKRRILILPPLFDEHNKMRHQLVEVMRRLDLSGIDSVLPDLPGCNESTAAIGNQSLTSWKDAAGAAASHFEATHILAVRGGGLVAPAGLPGWLYGAVAGKQLLRAMLRARTIAAREQGVEETTEGLAETGRSKGIELAGWALGPQMFAELEKSAKPEPDTLKVIEHSTVGGTPLWLRAEPDDDAEQADALAAIIAVGLDHAGRMA